MRTNYFNSDYAPIVVPTQSYRDRERAPSCNLEYGQHVQDFALRGQGENDKRVVWWAWP